MLNQSLTQTLVPQMPLLVALWSEERLVVPQPEEPATPIVPEPRPDPVPAPDPAPPTIPPPAPGPDPSPTPEPPATPPQIRERVAGQLRSDRGALAEGF